MLVKKEFELVKIRGSSTSNILSLSASTLNAFKLPKTDSYHVFTLIKTFGRTKPHPAGKILENHLSKMMVIDMDKYPLPGFITNRGLYGLNVSVLNADNVINYQSTDMYALALYTVALKGLVSKTPFKKDIAESISNYFFSIFMKSYGKKSGLVGSYSSLIPQLRFLINMYVYVSFFGESDTKRLRDKLANSLMMTYNDMKTDYDFSSITELLKAINDNNIVSISANTFSLDIINRVGLEALPMFEDLSRFFATLLASTISGNNVFSGYFKKVNQPLYNKLLDNCIKTLKRVL